MTLQIELDPQQAERLRDLARRLNSSVEKLAHAAVIDLVSRPDPDFEAAAERVLQKNAELYRRLA